MIKLTALHYKLKVESLERYHQITQHYDGLLFDWELAVDTARSTLQGYPSKPFIEPFEFDEDDYEVTEQKFRIKPQDVLFYKENLDKLTEITISGDVSFTVKESIEELDKFFE